MASASIPRDPTNIYLVVTGCVGGNQILAQEDPKVHGTPMNLYDALILRYRDYRKRFSRGTLVASMESKNLNVVVSDPDELLDVCVAAYSDDSSEDELNEEFKDYPGCVYLDAMMGNKVYTYAHFNPTDFDGPEALEDKVLEQCEYGHKQFGDVFITFNVKAKISKFKNDKASEAFIKEVCKSAYE